MKLIKTKKISLKKEENWDFDFSLYEDEDKKENELPESIYKFKRPQFSDRVAKWGLHHAQEAEIMTDISRVITKYGIKVEARTPDVDDISKFYGALSEYWEKMRPIVGSKVNKEIDDLRAECLRLIIRSKEKQLDPSIYEKILRLRTLIYTLKQVMNLGFETVNIRNRAFSRSQQKITQ